MNGSDTSHEKDGRPGEALRFQLHPAPIAVNLRRRKDGDAANRILRELADFFPVRVIGSTVRVAVDRGRAAEAPLRVATILDDIDAGWEEHFRLVGKEA